MVLFHPLRLAIERSGKIREGVGTMNYRTLGCTGLQVGEIGRGSEHVVREDQGMVNHAAAMSIDHVTQQ